MRVRSAEPSAARQTSVPAVGSPSKVIFKSALNAAISSAEGQLAFRSSTVTNGSVGVVQEGRSTIARTVALPCPVKVTALDGATERGTETGAPSARAFRVRGGKNDRPARAGVGECWKKTNAAVI